MFQCGGYEIPVHFYYGKDIDQTLITPACILFQKRVKGEAAELQKIAGPYIHPAIHAYPAGKGLDRFLYQLWGARCRHRFLARADITNSFPSTDIDRLSSIARKIGIKYTPHVTYDYRTGERIRYTGLPFGFHTSPLLFAIFLSPLARRLSRKYKILIYADDIFAITNTKRQAEAFLLDLELALKKNCSEFRPLKLSQKPHKSPRVIRPWWDFSFGGVKWEGRRCAS